MVKDELLLVCCATTGCTTSGAKTVNVTETANNLLTRRSLFMAVMRSYLNDYRRESSVCILKNSWNVSTVPIDDREVDIDLVQRELKKAHKSSFVTPNPRDHSGSGASKFSRNVFKKELVPSLTVMVIV